MKDKKYFNKQPKNLKQKTTRNKIKQTKGKLKILEKFK